MPTATFVDLPDQLLLYLRNTFLCELSVHVALSQTCRRLRDLYSKDDAFWQLACFSAGFGCPRRPQSTEPLTWRLLSMILSAHPKKCEIKSCKDANACFANHYRQLVGNGTLPSSPWSAEVLLHPLYFYLHFNQYPGHDASLSNVPVPDAISILLTLLPTFPECRTSQYGPLCSHPNACCAFATFPPMQSLNFQDAEGRTFLTVENSDGCTILDVNRALADLIPRDPTPLQAALAHYRDLMLTSGLTALQFVDAVSKQKGFLGDHEYPFLRELVDPV
ncbi:hypothetical protein ABKN59_004726 [Abortiporus biennis]